MIALEAGPKAVREVDSAEDRAALPFAEVHVAPPLAAVGRPAREVAEAARILQRNTEQKPSRRITYKVGLSSHTLLSSQAISASRSATTS